jgi:hypothetical protein
VFRQSRIAAGGEQCQGYPLDSKAFHVAELIQTCPQGGSQGVAIIYVFSEVFLERSAH